MKITMWIFLAWLCAGALWPTLVFSMMVDPATPTNAMPLSGGSDWVLTFSDEFNTNALDTSKWGIDVSASSRSSRPERGIADWWWRAANVSFDGSNLVLAVVKHDSNTMYCGSISSDGIFEPTYGYMEARVQIADTTKDTHTAFWMQSPTMGTVDGTAYDGAEIDIFESPYFADTATTTVHIDGYGADHRASGGSFSAPGLHSGFHVFGLEWTATYMKIFYDGVLKRTFTGTWVSHTNQYLWLSNGASFYDVGTFTNEAIGYLTDARFDYVRVWQVDNYVPEFQSDPIVKPLAVVGEAYSHTLADVTTDGDLDPLTFSKLSGPTWLTVTSDGALTGLPASTDLGTNTWTVQVVDGQGGTNSATLVIEVKNPWDPIVLVGGSILNGNFNAGTSGADLTYSATPEWYNMQGNQTAVATKADETYDGTQNALVQSGRLPGIDTGHTIEAGESFDISYVWKDSWSWVDGSDQIRVSLFVTDDNTITGTRTNLVTHDSGISTTNGVYESIDADRIHTAVAGDAGKALFAAIETSSAGFARLDNFELVVRPFTLLSAFTLTVSSDWGTPIPDGVTTNNAGSTIDAYLAGSPEETPGVVKYECTGWTGTGSGLTTGTGTNLSFAITEDTTLTWQWTTNYWVELNVAGE